MRIAIDIDGTLNTVYYDTLNYYKEFIREFDSSSGIILSEYEFKNRFRFDKDDYESFMRIYFPKIVKESKLLPYVKETIHELHNHHELICITSRDAEFNRPYQPYTGKQMVVDTLGWFVQNDLPFNMSNTYFSVKNKGEKCRELNVDIMIDDNPSHIKECIDNQVTCYFPIYPFNRYYTVFTNKYIHPMYSGWIDLLKFANKNLYQ